MLFRVTYSLCMQLPMLDHSAPTQESSLIAGWQLEAAQHYRAACCWAPLTCGSEHVHGSIADSVQNIHVSVHVMLQV